MQMKFLLAFFIFCFIFPIEPAFIAQYDPYTDGQIKPEEHKDFITPASPRTEAYSENQIPVTASSTLKTNNNNNHKTYR